MRTDVKTKNMNPTNKDVPPAADIPTITTEMVEEMNIEIAKRRAGRREAPMENIVDVTCPICGSQPVSFADNLVFEVVLTGERIVIPNLTGLRCSNCGDFAFDSDSSMSTPETNPLADTSAGSRRLAQKNSGCTFQKMFLWFMEITKKGNAIVTPLSRRKMLVACIESIIWKKLK